MMASSKIEWTDETWNPVSGCEKVSEGCRNCYAETIAHRFWGDRPFTEVRCHPERLDAPLHWKKPRRVFVNSMSDLFHEDVPDEFIDKVFAVMALTPQHTYQVLTKRPERMRLDCSGTDRPSKVAKAIDVLEVDIEIANSPYEIRPIPGTQNYLIDNTGAVFTTLGSATCIWCGQTLTHGQQDSFLCSQKCRSASHYAKTMGRDHEPAGRTKRLVPVDVGEEGHSRVLLIGTGRELVHRLVLRTFAREPLNGEQACHRDGNPQRNHICNLRWGTQSENWEDRIRHGNQRSYQKLDDRTVEAIRSRSRAGERTSSLANDYGISETQARNIIECRQWVVETALTWPLPNCWKGVSIEDQHTADKRIPILLRTPAAVRWISAEPLLGPVDLTAITVGHENWNALDRREAMDAEPGSPNTILDWVVLGGESGPQARPCNVDWIRSLVQQCRSETIPVFVKQVGSRPWSGPGNHPMHITDPKGGDPSEWPTDLRVREWPQ